VNLSLEIARLDLGRVSEKEKKIKKEENIISVIGIIFSPIGPTF
jgi:hypothetical protein